MSYNTKNKFEDKAITGGLAIVGSLALLIGVIIIVPFLSFVEGYFIGWLAKITIGGWLVKGAAALGITISKDSLPIIAGTLAFFGRFFKTNNVKWNKD